MNEANPDFHLKSVSTAGNENVRILKIAGHESDLPLSRRGFMTAAISIGSALGMLNKINSSAQPASLTSRLDAHVGSVMALAMTPDGTLLASSGWEDGNSIKLWSLAKRELTKLSGHAGTVNALAISPDGKWLASGSEDHSIIIWSLPEGRLFQKIQGHDAAIYALAVTSDGKFLISGSGDYTVRVWTFPEGQPHRFLGVHSGVVTALAIHPRGNVLFSASSDATIKAWSLATGEVLQSLTSHSGAIRAIAITRVGDLLASASLDRTVKLWSTSDYRLLKTINEPGISSLAITPDDRMLISGTDTRAMKLWSLLPDNGVEISLIHDGVTGEPLVNLVLRDRNATLLESDSVEGPWTPTRRNLREPLREEGKKFFRAESNLDVASGKLIKTLSNGFSGGTRTPLVISPDGNYLYAGVGGSIEIWSLETADRMGFLFDPAANQTDGVSYELKDPNTGFTLTFTLPCGSPIPQNSTCLCNCVQGTKPPPPGGGCFLIHCTCNSVLIPSDRAIKSNFSDVDCRAILERLLSLPIRAWKYNSEQSSARHVGPMSQDFAAAFGLGDDDRFINAVDAHGVTFAAIQALHELTEEKRRRLENMIETLKETQDEIARLRVENQQLMARLRGVEEAVGHLCPRKETQVPVHGVNLLNGSER